jgi:hypothetical protein
MKEALKRITIPAGSLIHIYGIPFHVTNNTEVESHPANVAHLTDAAPQELKTDAGFRSNAAVVGHKEIGPAADGEAPAGAAPLQDGQA